MVVLNALPKIALVPIFYIWLGDIASIYAMAIAVSVFITDADALYRLSGHRSRQDQAGAAVRRLAPEGADQDRAARQRADHDLDPEGQCRPALVGVVVGEFQAAKSGLGYLIIFGSQIFQMNLVMTAIVVLAVISSLLFVLIQALEGTGAAPPRRNWRRDLSFGCRVGHQGVLTPVFDGLRAHANNVQTLHEIDRVRRAHAVGAIDTATAWARRATSMLD